MSLTGWKHTQKETYTTMENTIYYYFQSFHDSSTEPGTGSKQHSLEPTYLKSSHFKGLTLDNNSWWQTI